MNYYVVDTETNGLRAGWHEVSEFSIIRCNDRVQLTKNIKVEYPERTSVQALQATNRTPSDLLRGNSKEEAVVAIDKFIQEDDLTPEHRVIICHNTAFDRRFCHALWDSVGKIFPANCWLDTQSIYKNYAKLSLGIEKPKATLEACLAAMNIKVRGQLHTALSDSQNTYILVEKLKKQGVDYIQYVKRVPHEKY